MSGNRIADELLEALQFAKYFDESETQITCFKVESDDDDVITVRSAESGNDLWLKIKCYHEGKFLAQGDGRFAVDGPIDGPIEREFTSQEAVVEWLTTNF